MGHQVLIVFHHLWGNPLVEQPRLIQHWNCINSSKTCHTSGMFATIDVKRLRHSLRTLMVLFASTLAKRQPSRGALLNGDISSPQVAHCPRVALVVSAEASRRSPTGGNNLCESWGYNKHYGCVLLYRYLLRYHPEKHVFDTIVFGHLWLDDHLIKVNHRLIKPRWFVGGRHQVSAIPAGHRGRRRLDGAGWLEE